MTVSLLLLACAMLSLILTAALRHYAHARQLMDIPNARSSHTSPTPRGGGMAFVASFLTALLLLGSGGALPSSLAWALAGGGGGIALLGFLDDHRHIAVRWRLLGHFAAAAWVLYWLGGMPQDILPGLPADLGWLLLAGGAFYLVWILNLYNFMDGIDGIAGVEALCVCLGGGLASILAEQPSLALPPVLLACAVSGFLYWNFPPARIFMGDGGSGFLGIVLGTLSLHAGGVAPELFWSWGILLGVFVVDATVTLLRRLVRGEAIHQAHRSHAYQHAARRFGGHLPVTLAVAAINLAWLLPMALLVAARLVDIAIGVALTYVPLIALALTMQAGAREIPKPSSIPDANMLES